MCIDNLSKQLYANKRIGRWHSMKKKKKRVSVRNIVFFYIYIALMHRLKDDKEYYVFPGGGLEKGETMEECAVREMMEEFGITIQPFKKIYQYEDDKRIHHFMLSKYVSGDFGSGNGEEYQEHFEEKGFYIPGKHNLETIKNLKLYPTEIKDILLQDYETLKTLNHDHDFEIKSVVVE